MDNEDYEVLQDLELAEVEDEPLLVCPPMEEPAVPSLYADCEHPYKQVGYSDRPEQVTLVRLSRAKYTAAEAAQRFDELRAERGWRVYGLPFFDARWWCWRVYR